MSLIEIMRSKGPGLGGGRWAGYREYFCVRNINNISFYGHALEAKTY